jgi:hypothetical protein
MAIKPTVLTSLTVTGALIAESGVTGDVTGDVTGQVFGTVTSYDDVAAIALTDSIAILDGTTNAIAATLANGTAGQRLIIKCTESTNDAVLTPANLADGATLTYGTALMRTELFFDGTTWQILTNTATLA